MGGLAISGQLHSTDVKTLRMHSAIAVLFPVYWTILKDRLINWHVGQCRTSANKSGAGKADFVTSKASKDFSTAL